MIGYTATQLVSDNNVITLDGEYNYFIDHTQFMGASGFNGSIWWYKMAIELAHQ